MLTFLPLLFLVVACVYAMAGFGGGSTYIAILVSSGLPLASVPVMALVCNLIVSGQGSVRLIRRRHAKGVLLAPLLASSIPASFLGGAWRLPQETFIFVLAIALTLAGACLLLQNWLQKSRQVSERPPALLALLGTGLGLGFLAGVTGIGGGIYLAPVMHLLGWARARTVAACTSLFIALNSVAGLSGQLTKGDVVLESIPNYVLFGCPIAVLVGGRIGTYFLTDRLSGSYVRFVTALVILLVAGRLWVSAFV